MTPAEARESIRQLGSGLPETTGAIRLAQDGPIATLILDNPTAQNALTLRMMLELADAVETLRDSDASVLRVEATGGGAFCSGGHLGQVRRAIDSPERAAEMARAMTAVLDGLLALPQISVAVLDGPAIGGGAELAVATDFRVAGAAGRIHFVHGALGIAPGWGGTGRLAVHVGPRIALRVLASARSLDATEAQGLGLIDAVADTGTRAADVLLGPVLERPAVSLCALKRQIVAARQGDRDSEADAFAAVWGGPAHREALSGLRAARDR